ncbi:hypothetical protein KDA00_00920 [Candidatus Saccharibacteria bacterium]|nr:hypothetical protein [Candidatus Saccharibacteria bacterium]
MEENKIVNTQVTPNINTSNVPNRGKGKLIGIFLAILVLFGAVFYAYYNQYKTLEDTKKVLESTSNELEKSTAKVLTLEDNAKVLRDKKRKKDLDLFTYAFRSYKADNGTYPTTEGSQSQRIYNDELSKFVSDFTEPTTNNLYGFEAIAQVHTPSPLELGVIQYQLLGKCNPDNQDFIDTTSENDAAIRTVLESGETYCLDI